MRRFFCLPTAVLLSAMGSSGPAPRVSMLSWSNIAPLAAAAAFALIWKALPHGSDAAQSQPVIPGVKQASVVEPFNVEKVLNDIVDKHLDRSAPAVTEPSLVDRLEPEVGVPVHAPNLLQYGARWEGGSVVPLVAHLVRDRALTPREIAELKQLIAQAERRGGKSRPAKDATKKQEREQP